MEANPSSEIGEVLERIKQLQQIKHSINVQQANLTNHLELTNHLIKESHDDGLGELLERVEGLQDRFDALLMIIEVQGKRVSTFLIYIFFISIFHQTFLNTNRYIHKNFITYFS